MEKVRFLKKVWSIAREYKWRFSLSYLLLLTELAFEQTMPLLLGRVIDAAVYKADLLLFFQSAAFYALFFAGQQVCGFAQLQFWQQLNNRYIYGLRVKCYEKILRQKAEKLTDMRTGDLLQIINKDTMEFHHILQRYAMRSANAGIGTAASLIIVACMKWEIALLIIVLIPLSTCLTNKIKNRMRTAAEKVREQQGRFSSWQLEILKGMREIKLFTAEKTVLKQFADKNKEFVKSDLKYKKTQFQSDQLIGLIYFAAQIVFYVTAALFVADGSIDIAEYISIAAYYNIISEGYQRILRDNMAFQARRTAIERVFSLLESESEEDESLTPLTVTQGEIEFAGISFSYKKKQCVLQDITYKILPGKHIGLVGASGVGKSTLAHLMVKLYEPDSGFIMIDGQDIGRCTCRAVRENIGIVSQETVIFNTTIKENICLGRAAGDEVIWDILDQVSLKEDIEKLPHGIYTYLGKDGMCLSGGQSQRLSIARTIFRNPRIVILDEATSALDETSETVVQQAIDRLTEGRTSFIISHRPGSIVNADDILILRDGYLEAHGTYEELIRNNRTFRKLFAAGRKGGKDR